MFSHRILWVFGLFVDVLLCVRTGIKSQVNLLDGKVCVCACGGVPVCVWVWPVGLFLSLCHSEIFGQ